ncbi:hypothetical protein [Raineyella fluvialis]|uniref:Uncharacterized protein n=1 Tax=Raineyella fluvialis TaxID=2662261 RepID=A0A5Q2FAP5_9ACTN|nr:hypothetical protein [Raineyella fluvialis]QGF22434.1 hypothetical protein Rai3103_00620 [Raineyella fluvialis]
MNNVLGLAKRLDFDDPWPVLVAVVRAMALEDATELHREVWALLYVKRPGRRTIDIPLSAEIFVEEWLVSAGWSLEDLDPDRVMELRRVEVADPEETNPHNKTP